MTENQDLRDDINKLTRELSELRRQSLRARRQKTDGEQLVRLARTTKDSGSSYPAPASSPYVFEIIFLDGTFTSTVGQQSISQTDQDDESQELAWFPTWIDENQLVEVFEQDNRWWISRVLGDLEDQLFAINAGGFLAPGGIATATLWQWDNISSYVQSAEAWAVTVYDRTDATNTQGRNCALPGEWVNARLNPRNNRWEVVGSYGLERKCSFAEIAAGGSGLATLYQNSAATSLKVTAHYNHGAATTIKNGTQGWVRWHPDETKWIVTARAGC